MRKRHCPQFWAMPLLRVLFNTQKSLQKRIRREKPGKILSDLRLKDIVRYAVVPVHIGGAVDEQAVIVGQLLGPGCAITVQGPVVPIEPAPQDRPAASVQKLLCNDIAAGALNVHNAYGLIGLAANGECVSSDNVQKKVCILRGYDGAVRKLPLSAQ